jgi:molybdopterin converting factor small subunit
LKDFDMQVHVHVHLHGILRDRLDPELKGRSTLDLPDGSSLQSLVDHLGLDGYLHASINEEIAEDFDSLLKNEDTVDLFRPSAGG